MIQGETTTVEMSIDNNASIDMQQQQQHKPGQVVVADSNNNIDSKQTSYQNGNGGGGGDTDPNNNPISMSTSNSHESLMYEQQQQQQNTTTNGMSHHHHNHHQYHHHKQENNNNSMSDHEGNSLMSNDYCSGNSKTNLIVNYLPQNMTQDEIKELFASVGPVESCKLIKDKLTGQSLGYAFVNYANQDDADKAIYNLNGMRLQNKTIKVSLARPSSESIKGANLYICGLPKTFTQMELEKMFTEFGTIISSKILTDSKTGESKGVGFVRFDKRMEAESAIEKLNGKLYENIPDPLVVKFANSPTSVKSVMGIPLAPYLSTAATSCRGFYQPYRSGSSAAAAAPTYRYSTMNVSPQTAMTATATGAPSAAALAAAAAYCAATGQHVDPTAAAAAAALLHPHSHQVAALNGLAAAASISTTPGLTTSSTAPSLATLSTAPILTAAATNGSATPNTQSTVTAAASTTPTGTHHLIHSPPPSSMSSHSLSHTSTSTSAAAAAAAVAASTLNYSGWCIFVYNLGPESDESLLWQLFGPFGAVQSVKVIRDLQTHKCKGFGFVTMTNYEEACTAINCLNGLNLQNRILQVSFKKNTKQMF